MQRINYFTAYLGGPRRRNQEAYLKALETRPLIDVVLGKFKNKQVRCRVPTCTAPGARTFVVREEKRTDVNIAAYMVRDAFLDACERFVLVSGDSDLVPTVNMVKTHFPHKRVYVYVPASNPVRGAAVELRASGDQDRTLPLHLLTRAQLPARVVDGQGRPIQKPPEW